MKLAFKFFGQDVVLDVPKLTRRQHDRFLTHGLVHALKDRATKEKWNDIDAVPDWHKIMEDVLK